MSEPLWDADSDFDSPSGLSGRIRGLRCMRVPTEEEVQATWPHWRSGDVDALLRTWREVAEPIRATVPFPASVVHPRMGILPPRINGTVYLITVRAGLAAGVRFRDSLRPQARQVIATRFPWLEDRHQHIPDGPTPEVDFPDVFRAFIDVDDPEEVAARWQLAAAANEIQQAAFTRWTARAQRLPELVRHAEREEALARNYIGHWRPACTPALWRQTLWVLDALNAALFAWVVDEVAMWLMLRGTWDACGDTWDRFVHAMDEPPPLVPVPEGQPGWRRFLDPSGSTGVGT